MPSNNTERTKALSAARAAAIQTLIEKHKSEFNGLMRQEAEARGEEWAPRLTEEEKAKREYDALIEKYPHLAQQPEEFPND